MGRIELAAAVVCGVSLLLLMVLGTPLPAVSHTVLSGGGARGMGITVSPAAVTMLLDTPVEYGTLGLLDDAVVAAVEDSTDEMVSPGTTTKTDTLSTLMGWM